MTLGLGLYSPYGLSVTWPNNTPFATAGYPFEASLDYITFNPVAAYKILPTLSLAAGPTINYAKLNLMEDVIGPNSGFRYNGDGVSVGANAGVLWQPCTKWSFGASYRSESRMQFHGDSGGASFFGSGTTTADAQLPFPQNIVGGISFRPTPKWNFEVDADWTDWHRLKSATVSSTPNIIPFGGAPTTLALDWQSSFFYEFGATYYLDDNWHVSGGYIFSENSIPDNTFSPVIPDSDRHIWSLGVGSKYKSISWDATYQLSWGPNRIVALPGVGTSSFGFLSHAIAVSVGYHF